MLSKAIPLFCLLAAAASQNLQNNGSNAADVFETPPPSNSSEPCTTSDGKAGVCVAHYNCNLSNRSYLINSVTVYPITEECESLLDVCCIVTDILTTPKPPIVTANKGCGYRNPEGVGFKTFGDVNGETNFAEFPWMCAIFRVYSDLERKIYIGGGSLIHPSVVLTAPTVHSAARFGSRPKGVEGLTVRAGEWDTRTTQELYPYQEREVESIEIHQDFNKANLFYDISLLFLTQPMDLAPNVALACLPPPPMPPLYSIQREANGTRCFATGWRKDNFEREDRSPNILKKIEVPVVDRDTCQAQLRSTRLGRYFQLHKSFMCAGGEPGKDTCMGHGGSPLSCPIESEENRYMQSGIVAWGIGCGTAGVPGVYVDVAFFRKWVDDKVSARGYDPKVYTF